MFLRPTGAVSGRPDFKTLTTKTTCLQVQTPMHPLSGRDRKVQQNPPNDDPHDLTVNPGDLVPGQNPTRSSYYRSACKNVPTGGPVDIGGRVPPGSFDSRLPDTESEIRQHYIDKLCEFHQHEHGDSRTFDFAFHEQLSTRELAFRYTKSKKAYNTVQSRENIKRLLKLVIVLVEEANNWVGLLRLKGWSAKLCKDMRKFNGACGRLAKKWLLSGNFPPLLEIGFIVLGSMLVHHFKPEIPEEEYGESSTPDESRSQPKHYAIRWPEKTHARARSTSPPPAASNNGVNISNILSSVLPMMKTLGV